MKGGFEDLHQNFMEGVRRFRGQSRRVDQGHQGPGSLYWLFEKYT